MRWAVLFFLVALAVGCSAQGGRVEDIQPGMFRSDVRAIMGEPDSIRHVSSIVEEWTYSVTTSNTATAFQCAGAAMQGAPTPPQCSKQPLPEEYELVVAIMWDEVLGYERYDQAGRALSGDGHQVTDREYEQYQQDHQAWKAREEAKRRCNRALDDLEQGTITTDDARARCIE